MSDLAEFLLARIAEDENAARIEVGRRDVILVGVFDPARVLAECDAKRRIVLLANAARDDDDDLLDQVRVMTLRLLALPYADHEGFRDEWRP